MVSMEAGKEVEPEVVSCRLPGPHCRPPTPYLGSAPGPGRHLTFHWAAAYLAGARLPPYHASQCQRHQVLQGPLQHCTRGKLGARREEGSRAGGRGLSGCCAGSRVPPLPPSLSSAVVQGWLAAVWGSLEPTKTSSVEIQNNFF